MTPGQGQGPPAHRRSRRRPPGPPARVPSAEEVVAVCVALESEYGSPRHGNPTDPFDDLLYILLSNRTAPAVAVRVFEVIKARFPSGEALADADEEELRRILAPAGLVNKRVAQIRGIVERLRRDFGNATLGAISFWPDDRAEAYLTALPGVSVKVAKCVLLYAMDRQVLPVDVHVHRVATRLGWISHKRADQSHESLEDLVPPTLRYGFHVNALAHGRAVCKAGLPNCGRCVVREWCEYFREGKPARTED